MNFIYFCCHISFFATCLHFWLCPLKFDFKLLNPHKSSLPPLTKTTRTNNELSCQWSTMRKQKPVVLPILLSNRDKALGVDDALSRRQNRGLLELLGVDPLGNVLQQTELPEVRGDGLRRPQAAHALMALGGRLRHLNLQVAFVLQIHGETTGGDTSTVDIRIIKTIFSSHLGAVTYYHLLSGYGSNVSRQSQHTRRNIYFHLQ